MAERAKPKPKKRAPAAAPPPEPPSAEELLAHPSRTAVEASGRVVALRCVAHQVEFEDPPSRVHGRTLRRDAKRLGVDPDLLDDDFLRALRDAVRVVLADARSERPELLDQLARDPVKVMRRVDPVVAARLAEVHEAQARAGEAAPESGEAMRRPRRRRPPAPEVSYGPLDADVAEAQVALAQWVVAASANRRAVTRDPDRAVANACPDASLAVRQTLVQRLADVSGEG